MLDPWIIEEIRRREREERGRELPLYPPEPPPPPQPREEPRKSDRGVVIIQFKETDMTCARL